MAKKKAHKKRTTHRRKKHKGLFGIGDTGGSADRLLAGVGAALLMRAVKRHVDDERTVNMVGLFGGGILAYKYPNNAIVNGAGLGMAVEGGLSLGERHFPWIMGISSGKIRAIAANVAQMRNIKVGTINNPPKRMTVGGMGASWGGSW